MTRKGAKGAKGAKGFRAFRGFSLAFVIQSTDAHRLMRWSTLKNEYL